MLAETALFRHARNAGFAVALCYAITLQALFAALTPLTAASADGSAFLTVICHTDAGTDGDNPEPVRDVPARHHCILCGFSANGILALAAAFGAPAPLQDRRFVAVAYAVPSRADNSPLRFLAAQSRGPPAPADA